LVKQRSYLDTIAAALVEKETLEQEQFYELVKDVIPEGKKQPMTQAILDEAPAAAESSAEEKKV
jgi:hypothetical protein